MLMVPEAGTNQAGKFWTGKGFVFPFRDWLLLNREGTKLSGRLFSPHLFQSKGEVLKKYLEEQKKERFC